MDIPQGTTWSHFAEKVKTCQHTETTFDAGPSPALPEVLGALSLLRDVAARRDSMRRCKFQVHFDQNDRACLNAHRFATAPFDYAKGPLFDLTLSAG